VREVLKYLMLGAVDSDERIADAVCWQKPSGISELQLKSILISADGFSSPWGGVGLVLLTIRLYRWRFACVLIALE
jgi:hypothetical protein